VQAKKSTGGEALATTELKNREKKKNNTTFLPVEESWQGNVSFVGQEALAKVLLKKKGKRTDRKPRAKRDVLWGFKKNQGGSFFKVTLERNASRRRKLSTSEKNNSTERPRRKGRIYRGGSRHYGKRREYRSLTCLTRGAQLEKESSVSHQEKRSLEGSLGRGARCRKG